MTPPVLQSQQSSQAGAPAAPSPTAAPRAARPALPPHEPAPPRVFLRLELGRGNAAYSRDEYIRKALWRLVQATVFRISPTRFRTAWLRFFGAEIHPTAHIRGTVRVHHPWLLRVGAHATIGDRVDIYNLGPVVIGDQTAISQNVHLCAGTHDWKNPSMPLIRSGVTIGAGTWICADAFIGPDVRIGHNSLVAAGAVVVKDVADATIVGGNPAKVLGPRPLPGWDGNDGSRKTGGA